MYFNIFIISLKLLSLEYAEILVPRVEAFIILGEHPHGVVTCFITEVFTFVLSLLYDVPEKAIVPIFLC